ncbi:formate dehydrogenase accessory sulfurtransferase FdhD [Sphingorhabdus sp.]|uniref:formate dehydrogenase accessory sulfurtransferase FdhD n=1 Tax=Sphingorhabdus sp. TaxID=1902408 RepID=UPI0032B75C06
MFPVTVTGTPPAVEQDIGLSNGAHWAVPEETPVAFVYGGSNYAVMLATPADLIDFATGFSMTEGVIDAPDDIASLDIHHLAQGTDLRLRLNERCQQRLDLRQRRRTLPGNAGCGLCGIENAEEFFQPLKPVAEKVVQLKDAVVERAFNELPTHQPLNAATRTVHAAAWAGPDGGIVLAREDVGRHNALDKLLGVLATEGADLGSGFIVMSSRCSYEIVQKAARMGVSAIACLSAPTAFAIRKAREANIAIHVRDGSGTAAIS